MSQQLAARSPKNARIQDTVPRPRPAAASPAHASPTHVLLTLQRAIGNQRVARLIANRTPVLPRTIQRQPNPAPTTTTPGTPTERDYRDMVSAAISFLNGAAQNYALLTNFDQPRIDTMVEKLFTTITAQEALITGHLNNDPALRQTLRTAYTGAIRALLARAASTLHTSVFDQYARYIDKVPTWAWPNASALGANTEAQKRAFIATVATTFSGAGVFANLTAIDQPKLEEILTRCNATVTELETMINTQLGGDAALRLSLHDSFRNAIRLLLSRASPTIGQSDFNLYMRYRYGPNPLIPAWVDQSVANISTALPVGAAAPDASGAVTMTINGMRVVIRTDTTQAEAGAQTNININAGALSWRGRDRNITFTAPPTPQITIRTAYGPGMSATTTSSYGRGTTADDRSAGNTSLGFHEGSHGRGYLGHMQQHAFPVFTGTSTMTVAQFRAAVRTWDAAVTAYSQAINRESALTVDCVGTTIETFHRGRGTRSPVNCTP